MEKRKESIKKPRTYYKKVKKDEEKTNIKDNNDLDDGMCFVNNSEDQLGLLGDMIGNDLMA